MSGLPLQSTESKFPQDVALQIIGFLEGPERRGGVVVRGAQAMTFSAAYKEERDTQWADVWPAIKHPLWHGDDVHERATRAAHLAALSRALLANETVDQANLHIEGLQNTELHKVLKEPGMSTWLHKTYRDTKVGTPHPSPVSYAATQRSSTHILTSEGFSLCRWQGQTIGQSHGV